MGHTSNFCIEDELEPKLLTLQQIVLQPTKPGEFLKTQWMQHEHFANLLHEGMTGNREAPYQFLAPDSGTIN